MPTQDLSEVELPLLGAAVAEGPEEDSPLFFLPTNCLSFGRVPWVDGDVYMVGRWCWSGEAIEDHKIQELAHLTKMMQIQQEMDLKVEKMLFLGYQLLKCMCPYYIW